MWGQPCFEVVYAVVGGEDAWDDFRELLVDYDTDNSPGRSSPLYFLSLHLKQVVSGPLHDHYDYDSPWCFPVEVTTGEVWSIKRVADTEGGEVPDFEKIEKYLAAAYGMKKKS